MRKRPVMSDDQRRRLAVARLENALNLIRQSEVLVASGAYSVPAVPGGVRLGGDSSRTESTDRGYAPSTLNPSNTMYAGQRIAFGRSLRRTPRTSRPAATRRTRRLRPQGRSAPHVEDRLLLLQQTVRHRLDPPIVPHVDDTRSPRSKLP
jgi:hypothetical protein